MTDEEATKLWEGELYGWKVVQIECTGNHSRWGVTERTIYRNETGELYYVDWEKVCGGDGLEPSEYGPEDHGPAEFVTVQDYLPLVRM